MGGIVDNNRDDIFEEAVQRFADAQLNGQQPDIEEFARQYPQFEEQLRERLQNLKKVDTLLTGLVRTDEGDFADTVTGHDLVGQKIGSFEIVEMIGRGGMGVVYLACDTKLKRSVAIKSMPAKLAADATARMRFRREAELLASLNHPNIAVIHDIVEQGEGAGYLILEYVPGEIGKLSQPGGSLYNIEHSNGGLITFPGGVPLKNSENEIIGAIGVSGSTVENDHTVAEAGAGAIS